MLTRLRQRLFKPVLMSVIAGILGCISAGDTYAETLSCGATVVTVTDAVSADAPFFSVRLQGASVDQTLQFSIAQDFLYARCETAADGRHVLLLNHFCSGSGCADFGNFGIIAAQTGEILLHPDQRWAGNRPQAERILGTPIHHFACTGDGKEICLHTRLELG